MAIAPHDPLIAALSQPGWREYLSLTKPKVSLLIVFTAIVGMVLASPGMVPLPALVFGTLGIAMASGSAATLNHILDRRIDRQMARTRRRPLATGSLRTSQAVAFAGVLCVGSMMVLWLSAGSLCALLTFGSVIGYAVVYTGWLKRATPQNIVIGGASGTGVGGRDSLHRCAGIGIVHDHLYVDTTAFLVASHCAARGVREGGDTHVAGYPRYSVHAPSNRA